MNNALENMIQFVKKICLNGVKPFASSGFIFLLLVFNSAYAEVTFPLSESEKERVLEQEHEFPMNWEKSTVSRGFGTVIPELSKKPDLLQQFKAGEVAYFFKNYQKAMNLWLPLAQGGLADAQANIAWMLQQGLGVPRDLSAAKSWYLKAVKQNHAVAQNNLGAMYEHALGVEKNFQLAFKYYLLAAKNDYRFAYYNLGNAYLKGIGTQIDKPAAKTWLQKAVDSKVEQAVELLADIK